MRRGVNTKTGLKGRIVVSEDPEQLGSPLPACGLWQAYGLGRKEKANREKKKRKKQWNKKVSGERIESPRGLTVASGGAPTLSDGEFIWGPLWWRNAPRQSLSSPSSICHQTDPASPECVVR